MGEQPIKVLLIEDNPGDARLIREMLTEVTGGGFEIERATRLSAGIERLAGGGIDAVLLDLSLPDSQGIETYVKARARAPNLPVVVLSGSDDEHLAVRAVHEGAQDYLVKGHVNGNLLARSVRYALERSRLTAEVKKTQQQQLMLRDQILSHVSHELRTPLTAIYWFTSNLLDGLVGDLTPEQREHLELTLRNADQLKVLIGDLLEATRAEAGKIVLAPRCTPVAELTAEVSKTCRVSASAKNIQVIEEVPSGLPLLWADPKRTRQVLLNLIENAVKFTAEGGTVALRAQVSNDSPGTVQISVKDSGCGISPENRSRIFERLFQEPDNGRGAKGLGLGLFIAKDLVSRQGGTIWVESQLGRGSTFFFTLPIFSWARLCEPVLSPGNLRFGSLALIWLEIVSGDTAVDCDVVAPDARKAVERCIMSDRDLLLPRSFRSKGPEPMFVVAGADESGAKVIVDRIRAKVQACLVSHNERLSPVISFTVIDASGVNENEAGRKDLAAQIETLIEVELQKRRAL